MDRASRQVLPHLEGLLAAAFRSASPSVYKGKLKIQTKIHKISHLVI